MREYATLHNRAGKNKNKIEGIGATKPVPVANTGGPGTAEGHWRENIFDHELMTGYAEDSGPMPLSRLTIAALEDLGYAVDYDQADDFALPSSGSSSSSSRHIKTYCKARFPELQVQSTPPKRPFARYVCGCCSCCVLLIGIIVILVFAMGLDCDDSLTENILDPIRLYDSLC